MAAGGAEAVDDEGRTPLMHAAYADDGTPQLIQLLISKGADVHVVGKGDTAGETAVTIAAKRGETEILRILRDAAGK